MKTLTDVNAEKILLGLLLENNHSIKNLSESSFSDRRHRLVFRAIEYFCKHKSCEGFGAQEVKRELELCGNLNEVGEDYFAEIFAVRQSGLYEEVESIVLDLSLRREILYLTEKAQEKLLSNSGESVLSWVLYHLGQLVKPSVVPISQMNTEELDDLERRWGRGTMMQGIPSGFQRLDSITLGYKPGDLVVVSGPPGVGKTSFLVNTAVQLSDDGYAVLFFSLEQTKTEIWTRINSLVSGTNSQRVSEGRLTKSERRAFNFESPFKTKEWRLWIDDHSRHLLSVEDVYTQALGLKQKNGLDIILIDHLSLLRAEGRGQTSHELKQIAQSLAVPIVLVCHLKSRAKKNPGLSDLSRVVAGRAADIVIFFSESLESKNIRHASMIKIREGVSRETFDMGFIESLRFVDLSRIYDTTL